MARGWLSSPKRDEGGADGGDGEGEPAGRVHALAGEEGGADGEDDGHGSDHERGVGDGGAVEAGELDEELKGDSEEGADEEGAPFAAVEGGAVGEEQRDEGDGGEEEAVEHHGADAHFDEGDLAEEEAAAPEGAGEGAGGEAEGAVSLGNEHLCFYSRPKAFCAQSGFAWRSVCVGTSTLIYTDICINVYLDMVRKKKVPIEVVRGSGNVFADLGLPNPEQELMKARLTLEIARIIKDRGLTQSEAAKILGVQQPHVSALARNRAGNFSVGRLMEFLTALGQDVEIVVKPTRKEQGAMSVVFA